MNNNPFLESLKERVGQATKELEARKRESLEAAAKEQQAAKDLQGYQQALEAELRRTGQPPIGPQQQPKQPLVSVNGNAGNEVEEYNRTNVVRQFFIERGEAGGLPKELGAHLRQQPGIISPTFHYTSISRLLKRKELEQRRNGRYYATDKMRTFLTRGEQEAQQLSIN